MAVRVLPHEPPLPVQAAKGRGRAVLVRRRETSQARAAVASVRAQGIRAAAGDGGGRAAAGPAEAGFRAAGRGQAAAPPAAGAGEPRRQGEPPRALPRPRRQLPGAGGAAQAKASRRGPCRGRAACCRARGRSRAGQGEPPRALPRPRRLLPGAGAEPRRPRRAAAGPAEAAPPVAGRGRAAAPPAAGAGEPRRPGRGAAGPAEAAPPAAGAVHARRAEHAQGHTHGRRRGGERERSRTSSSDGLAVADHDPGALGRGERWCASRRTTLLPLGLKSAGGETVPDGPSSGVGVGSRCCTPSPRTKAILSSSEEEEVASTATAAVDVDAIWPTGRPRGPVDFRAVSRVRARGRAGEVT
eukprot:XP_020397091.1 tropomyosin-1, isoforms 33/34 [Zea mays]